MQFQCLEDCAPALGWLIAFHALLAGAGFVIAREHPWMLLVILPAILLGQVLVFGVWWYRSADYAIRAAAMLVPILGALSGRELRKRAGNAGTAAG